MSLNRESGFTMIELLVALLVLAVGLLGMASLQAVGMRQTINAQLTSQAVNLARDMAERMRANPVGIKAGAYDAVTGSEQDPGCQPVCSPLQQAALDAFEWADGVRRALGGYDDSGNDNGTVVSLVTANADGTFTIRVGWNELGEEGAQGNSFVLRFQP